LRNRREKRGRAEGVGRREYMAEGRGGTRWGVDKKGRCEGRASGG